MESQKHLANDRGGSRLSKFIAMGSQDFFHQMAATHELSNDVVIASILHEVIYAGDVRMLNGLQNFELILVQLFVDLVLAQFLLLDDLDGAGHFGAPMLADMNRAERALAESFAKLVVLAEAFNVLKLHLRLEGQEVVLDLFLLKSCRSAILVDYTCLTMGIKHRFHTLGGHRAVRTV